MNARNRVVDRILSAPSQSSSSSPSSSVSSPFSSLSSSSASDACRCSSLLHLLDTMHPSTGKAGDGEEGGEEDGDDHRRETDWVWMHDVATGDNLSVTEVAKDAKRYAVLLRLLGLGRGDVVHLVLGDDHRLFPVCFGVWAAGGVISLGDANSESRAIARQLSQTHASFVFCTGRTWDLVAVAHLEKKDVHARILCLDETDDEDQDVAKLLRTCDHSHDWNDEDEVVADTDVKKDIAAIFWTAGTSGLPKGICHSHFSVLNFCGDLSWRLGRGSRILATTGLSHSLAFSIAINAILNRQTVFHWGDPALKPLHVMRAVAVFRPAHLIMGNHHYTQLAHVNPDDLIPDDDEDEEDANHVAVDLSDPTALSSVQLMVPLGASVPANCEDLLRRRFPNLVAVVNVYSQSESGAVAMGYSTRALGSIFPGVRIKIENFSTGERCGPGEEGEICVKTPTFMLKYLNRPMETSNYFDFEGFGHTGDIGRYDADGNVYWLDRSKELIKVLNIHVAPTEIESVLCSHPAVKESLVYGRGDYLLQEIICAVVVLHKGESVSEADLLAYANSRVNDVKQIRGGITFVADIPKTSSGTILRKDLKKWAKALRDSVA